VLVVNRAVYVTGFWPDWLNWPVWSDFDYLYPKR
ncbi:hypothetical protein A2U01_0105658, partial [Trifolium medium]|nr:hypothetical protein [Trifolium medium]